MEGRGSAPKGTWIERKGKTCDTDKKIESNLNKERAITTGTWVKEGSTKEVAAKISLE